MPGLAPFQLPLSPRPPSRTAPVRSRNPRGMLARHPDWPRPAPRHTLPSAMPEAREIH
ncbi:Putative HTLV-1-related endogenous sequence (fragment) [Cupriavidus necator]|uniref:Putative HTLV-1-related endogenous sequence n=1 Tax=Cupriavidus necator TaxID=106590 RepID=A0A1K0JMT3_CUPNE